MKIERADYRTSPYAEKTFRWAMPIAIDSFAINLLTDRTERKYSTAGLSTFSFALISNGPHIGISRMTQPSLPTFVFLANSNGTADAGKFYDLNAASFGVRVSSLCKLLSPDRGNCYDFVGSTSSSIAE